MSNVVDHLVSIFGSQAKVGELAGVKQSSVALWKVKNEVPTYAAKMLLAEAAARGKNLTADDLLGERKVS